MLDEQTIPWLVILGIGATAILYRLAGKRSDRKRCEWFESVATAFGAQAEHVSDVLSRFTAVVDERSCEVAYRYSRGWRFVATVPLIGVGDIYSFVLQPSRNPAENGVRVRNYGFSPREGWLNADVRAAVAHFYELAPGSVPLAVERGALVSYTADRVEGRVFRNRVSGLVLVAKALERTL